MKPAPPEIWRFAASFWQWGQDLSGAALIDCSASQAWPHSVHKYSYVIRRKPLPAMTHALPEADCQPD
jgi:hypothetical protein